MQVYVYKYMYIHLRVSVYIYIYISLFILHVPLSSLAEASGTGIENGLLVVLRFAAPAGGFQLQSP